MDRFQLRSFKAWLSESSLCFGDVENATYLKRKWVSIMPNSGWAVGVSYVKGFKLGGTLKSSLPPFRKKKSLPKIVCLLKY